jgi:uncharacterized protein (AIM24 family)
MFCTHCGARIREDGIFCEGCGARVKRAEESVAPPPAPAPAPSMHQTVAAAAVTCSWCGALVQAGQEACPKCGAALDKLPAATQSGWKKLPGRKDMAKLQFGNSFCQIEGLYVPVADMNLAAGDSVYFTHHVLLWKDPQVEVTTVSLAGAWKRLFAGMPLIMTQAQGPGHIAFSRDAPGEMVALPIHPGQAVDVREHLFLTATSNVTYDWFSTNIWFKTQSGSDNNETETHYPLGMFMDRFMAPQSPGLLLLHAAGNVFVRELGPGQTILVKPAALIFKDPAVQMHLHFEQPSTGFSLWGSWSNRYLWLRLVGPGRVAVQSVFDAVEGESGNMIDFSYATEQRW